MMMGSHDLLFLQEGVLVNVLLKLPVKTLLRFRCVCKQWCNLISDDPYFFQLHLDHHQSISKQSFLFHKSNFLISTDREGNPKSRFEVKFTNRLFPIVIPTRFDLVCFRDGDMVHICNPSTHKSIILPKPPLVSRRFDRSCDGIMGFGYVQSTDEYKVVRLIPPDYSAIIYGLEDEFSIDATTTKCQVFTMGTERRGSTSCSSSSTWRNVMDSPYDVDRSPPAFVNGAIHWLVMCWSKFDIEIYHGNMIDPNNTIVVFDIEREEFRLLPHPEGCPDLKSSKPYEHQLVELKGLLCLSCTQGSKMDIWMFKDYYYGSGNDHISGTWVKEYSIDLNVLHDCDTYDCDTYAPRDIEDTKVLIETRWKSLDYYHLQTTSFEGFMDSERMPWLRFSLYVESLRSLKKLE